MVPSVLKKVSRKIPQIEQRFYSSNTTNRDLGKTQLINLLVAVTTLKIWKIQTVNPKHLGAWGYLSRFVSIPLLAPVLLLVKGKPTGQGSSAVLLLAVAVSGK